MSTKPEISSLAAAKTHNIQTAKALSSSPVQVPYVSVTNTKNQASVASVVQSPYNSKAAENDVESNPIESTVASDYQEERSGAYENNAKAAALICKDAELRKIVETTLQSTSNNLEAARKIESNASARFGGRFNSIVSDSEFAYVNWYGNRNCQLKLNNRQSLTWED